MCTHWANKIICFSIDFSVDRVHDNRGVLLKSIFVTEINPLIKKKNRFRVSTRFRLFKQNPNKCTFISTIQIFHVFPPNISYFPSFFYYCIFLNDKEVTLVKIRFSILKKMQKNDENFTLTFNWKWVMTFYRFSLLCCLSKCWNNFTVKLYTHSSTLF